MGLMQAYTAVRIMEAGENYARADIPRVPPPQVTHLDFEDRFNGDYYDDQQIWKVLLHDSRRAWGRRFHFHSAVVSEWVARVPGLYWTRGAEEMRRLTPTAIERLSREWVEYRPWGKSQQVAKGGIGTLRFPAAEDGTRLITLTTSLNVSAGIPALVMPDIWDRIFRVGPRGLEGKVLEGSGRWQPMGLSWASRFPSTRDIPRGYLILDGPDDIWVREGISPTLIHPFTIMEYRAGATELFDFVYAEADTAHPHFRRELEAFFQRYKQRGDRYGRYLLEGDMVDSMWDAEYHSPADLQRAEPSGKAQLELLEARVRERMLGKHAIDEVLKVLGSASTSPADLRRLSQDIGIEPSLWMGGNTLAKMCNQFVAEVVRQGDHKVEELIEVLATTYARAPRQDERKSFRDAME